MYIISEKRLPIKDAISSLTDLKENPVNNASALSKR